MPYTPREKLNRKNGLSKDFRHKMAMAPMLNASSYRMFFSCDHKMRGQNAQLNFVLKFAKNPIMHLCRVPQDRPKGVAEILLREKVKFDRL